MAAAVARTFERGGVLLAEAGTGTGKTLAYLIPAILSRQRVLISTGTKNLQEQIFFKDLPALRDAIGVPFTAAYMKGRANYLCLHRLDQLMGEAQSPAAQTTRGHVPGRGPTSRGWSRDNNRSVNDSVFLPMIRDWAAHTDTGDRAELEDLPEDLPFWNDVSASIETCIGSDCPRHDDCFVTRMRQRAAAADLVVVNHHLLCADAAVRQNAYGEVIPSCANAILDEAHQLEDVATQYFGVAVSGYRVDDLALDIERVVSSRGGRQSRRDPFEGAVERLRDRSRECFTAITFAHRSGGLPGARAEERIRVTPESVAPAADAVAELAATLGVLEASLTLLSLNGRDPNVPDAVPGRDESLTGAEAIASLARRAGQIRDDLRFLMRADDAAFVYFVEFRGKGVFLRASPIDVSRIVRELLLDRMHTTVLTSATLAVDGSFEYIRTRLGIRNADEIRLPSEFDYASQAILYLPRRMPDPRSPEFGMAAGREVVEILRRTRGRAFVLFTSYAGLRTVQAITEMALPYPILVQGTAPRSQLLRQFRETPRRAARHVELLAGRRCCRRST
jgi:ATP-dependent DNA helicase DinG